MPPSVLDSEMDRDSLVTEGPIQQSSPAPIGPGSPTPTPATQYRKFGDAAGTRKALFANVLSAAQKIEPAANPRHQLAFADVGYHGPEDYSLADQKQAILSRGTLARPLRATAILSDVDGNELKRRKVTLAKVPYLTNRGTFVVNGNEYTMAHQMRLRPGVFTRVMDNGELESHVNVSKGYGHRVFLDPKTGIFRIKMGQAKIPLLPLLRAQGVTDKQIRESWGNELAAVNMEKADPQAINKLYSKLHRDGDADELERKALVRSRIWNSIPR